MSFVGVQPLIDRFSRIIGSVRFSITDRCNLRCNYCMPEEGIQWMENEKILSYEEITYLATLFNQHGIKNFRLTGGEPTLRKDVVKLIKMLKDRIPDSNLAMTTNGINLVKLAKPLKEAGLSRLNISLDILDHEKFLSITRRDYFDKVIEGINHSLDVGFDQIKINAVSIKGFNNDYDTIKTFIDFSELKDVEIRFIEYMPFTGSNWKNGGFISSKDLRELIANNEKMIPLKLIENSQTSRIWSLRNGKAKIGFISSVSETFCDSCNRIRITAEGNLRPCLHSSLEYPLRDLIRSKSPDEKIIQIIKTGIHEKWKEHPDFLSLTYLPPLNDREMIKIGG